MSTTEEFDWGTLTPVEAASETEQPAETEDSPVEPAAATAPKERPRDPETGQFLPKETAEEEGERLLAGKYRSPEALEQAYLEAQRLLGSLRSDQGELRSQLEQLTEAVQQSRPQTVQDFDALLASDPQQAALYALTVGDALAALSRLCLLEYQIDEKTKLTRLPNPDERQKEILAALGVSLPKK